jgi:16S rRNA (uracil1498-N3)-methyltransferase
MIPDGRPGSGVAGPHVFVDDLEHLVLSDPDRHHLSVLRVRLGDPLTVSDGAGRWRAARFADPLEPAGEITIVARADPAITVLFAPVKGDRPEWVVQKLTEVGADTIVPLVAERSVVVWPAARIGHQLERLRRISREAAMQSRQCYLPEVAAPLTFADAAVLDGVCLAHMGGDSPSLARPTVLVGPEGGWSDRELEFGLPRVGLGPSVLRAETAAVAAGVLLAALRSGLVHGHVG